MRKLSFIFIIASAFIINAAAQAPAAEAAKQAFDVGARAARSGQYEKALGNFRKAFLLSENNETSEEFLARIHFNVGVCLYQLKRPDEATREFTRAIELSRGNYQKAFYALGMAQTELKNWDAAETAFREAVSLKRDDGEAWFDLGLVLLEAKKSEAAQIAFQNAIKYRSAAVADAHNNLGVILALKGDLPSAEGEFETALRSSGGKSVEALNNLRFCKARKQNLSQTLIPALEYSK